MAFAQELGRQGTAAYLYELNATVFEPLFEEMGAPYLGVSHFSDIPYVFASVQWYLGNDTSGAFATENLALGQEVSGSWARFAKTGVPSGKGVLEGWPVGGCGEEVVVRIIGGPGDGVAKMGELAKRCEFINSKEVMAELMT